MFQSLRPGQIPGSASPELRDIVKQSNCPETNSFTSTCYYKHRCTSTRNNHTGQAKAVLATRTFCCQRYSSYAYHCVCLLPYVIIVVITSIIIVVDDDGGKF